MYVCVGEREIDRKCEFVYKGKDLTLMLCSSSNGFSSISA